jgi:AhpC/TSA family
MRKVLIIPLMLLLTYSFLVVAFYFAMCQKPDVFSSIMARTPGIVFLIFPFKPMWLSARKGNLDVGDAAPDFSLETHDKKSRVRLSDFRGKKPVVLVFGSYT